MYLSPIAYKMENLNRNEMFKYNCEVNHGASLDGTVELKIVLFNFIDKRNF